MVKGSKNNAASAHGRCSASAASAAQRMIPAVDVTGPAVPDVSGLLSDRNTLATEKMQKKAHPGPKGHHERTDAPRHCAKSKHHHRVGSHNRTLTGSAEHTRKQRSLAQRGGSLPECETPSKK